MSSGTFNTLCVVAEFIDEAVERAGMDPAVVVGSHIKSILRSMRFMLNSEWASIGIRQWQIVQAATHTTAVGETFFNPPAGFLDITEAVLRRPGPLSVFSDVEMYAITRQQYTLLTTKTNQGRPDRYFVDRQAGFNANTGLSNAVVNYWQAGSNTTDQIVYNYFHQDQDITDNLADTLDIPVLAKEAFVAGLASKIALKWNKGVYVLLEELYRGPNWATNPMDPGGALGALRGEDRERGDIQIYPAFEPRTGRR